MARTPLCIGNATWRLTAMLLVIACSEHSPTAPSPEKLSSRLVVSAPFARSVAASPSATGVPISGVALTAVTDDSLVYVSMPPGSMPDGDNATVLNRATRQTLSVPLVDGGFDPIAVDASVGDTLEVETPSRSTVGAIDFAVVPRRRPPQIVRTDPPKGKTDVPLNTQIVVVFSEPVDPATVAAAVRLFSGSTVVPGALTLSASGIDANFAPDAPLAPNTIYELVVDKSVRNLRGDGLESEVHVSFTTGPRQPTDGPPPSSGAVLLAISILPNSVVAGQPVTYMVTAKDASGNIVTGYTGTMYFASTDPAAQLPQPYTFVAGEGSHIFTATFPTAGSQSMTVTDELVSAINGGATVNVVNVTGFAAISSGYVSSCGLTTNGNAYCWGTNDLGRLGDGTTQDNPGPVAVTGGLRFTSLRVGSVQACGLTTDGAAYCWGSNLFASLGIGTNGAPQMCYSADWAEEGAGNQPCSPSPTPVVSSGVRFVALSAGGSSTMCGLEAGGAVYCWGYGRDGELGNGTTTNSNVPAGVSGGLHFASVSTSGYHSCGLTTAGVAYCWGYNDSGALGDASTTSHIVPKPVATNLRFVTLSSGGDQSCGLTMDGTAYCWGANNSGQLGDGSLMNSTVPVPVSGGLRFASLSTDTNHTCGLTTSGEAYCWGQNFDGQLGDGTTTSRNFPVRVSGGLRFVSLSAGHRHTCGITTEGTYCWGANDYWQFGDGTSVSSVIPVKAAAKP